MIRKKNLPIILSALFWSALLFSQTKSPEIDLKAIQKQEAYFQKINGNAYDLAKNLCYFAHSGSSLGKIDPIPAFITSSTQRMGSAIYMQLFRDPQLRDSVAAWFKMYFAALGAGIGIKKQEIALAGDHSLLVSSLLTSTQFEQGLSEQGCSYRAYKSYLLKLDKNVSTFSNITGLLVASELFFGLMRAGYGELKKRSCLPYLRNFEKFFGSKYWKRGKWVGMGAILAGLYYLDKQSSSEMHQMAAEIAENPQMLMLNEEYSPWQYRKAFVLLFFTDFLSYHQETKRIDEGQSRTLSDVEYQQLQLSIQERAESLVQYKEQLIEKKRLIDENIAKKKATDPAFYQTIKNLDTSARSASDSLALEEYHLATALKLVLIVVDDRSAGN